MINLNLFQSLLKLAISNTPLGSRRRTLQMREFGCLGDSMQGQGQVVWERGDHFFEAINLKYDCIEINLFETFVVSYNNCSFLNNVNL